MNNEKIKQAMAKLAALNAKIASNSTCNAFSEENHKNAIEIVLEALQSFLELGITPEQMREIDKLYAWKCMELEDEKEKHAWIPAYNTPETDDYILLSFDNLEMIAIGEYREDEYGGSYYLENSDEPLVSIGVFVNAWKPLPEPCREETV